MPALSVDERQLRPNRQIIAAGQIQRFFVIPQQIGTVVQRVLPFLLHAVVVVGDVGRHRLFKSRRSIGGIAVGTAIVIGACQKGNGHLRVHDFLDQHRDIEVESVFFDAGGVIVLHIQQGELVLAVVEGAGSADNTRTAGRNGRRSHFHKRVILPLIGSRLHTRCLRLCLLAGGDVCQGGDIVPDGGVHRVAVGVIDHQQGKFTIVFRNALGNAAVFFLFEILIEGSQAGSVVLSQEIREFERIAVLHVAVALGEGGALCRVQDGARDARSIRQIAHTVAGIGLPCQGQTPLGAHIQPGADGAGCLLLNCRIVGVDKVCIRRSTVLQESTIDRRK